MGMLLMYQHEVDDRADESDDAVDEVDDLVDEVDEVEGDEVEERAAKPTAQQLMMKMKMTYTCVNACFKKGMSTGAIKAVAKAKGKRPVKGKKPVKGKRPVKGKKPIRG